ncbi:TAT [Cordylochernes scorpioides]|uniref:TAT n=1 Tax=Cordylochernes scorpioides TaxID=51811 RepID=A0ABY6JW99_9ARAC|nr:TAT [Cordylochernes scorpioides]
MCDNATGDPTVFGNMRPCEEITEAVVDSVRSHKFDGYAPSTGKPNILLLCEKNSTNVILHLDKDSRRAETRWHDTVPILDLLLMQNRIDEYLLHIT